MVVLRSASEQQLARDCLSGVDVCDPSDGGKSPSIETLMALLWAIKVVEKEQARMTPKPDAVAEVRRSCSELDGMFSLREMNGRNDRFSFVSSRSSSIKEDGQKSLDGEELRVAFQDGLGRS